MRPSNLVMVTSPGIHNDSLQQVATVTFDFGVTKQRMPFEE